MCGSSGHGVSSPPCALIYLKPFQNGGSSPPDLWRQLQDVSISASFLLLFREGADAEPMLQVGGKLTVTGQVHALESAASA